MKKGGAEQWRLMTDEIYNLLEGPRRSELENGINA